MDIETVEGTSPRYMYESLPYYLGAYINSTTASLRLPRVLFMRQCSGCLHQFSNIFSVPDYPILYALLHCNPRASKADVTSLFKRAKKQLL